MSPDHLALARHALGLPNTRGRSYRNRFFASKGSLNWDDLHDMVALGLMNAEDVGEQTHFWLTRLGAEEALQAGETLDTEDFPDVP
jgi:hypothetical protein